MDSAARESEEEAALHARIQIARRRCREFRWSAPRKAMVRHPEHGEITVPCRSKTSAILCAAEKWGVRDWLELAKAAEVTAAED